MNASLYSEHLIVIYTLQFAFETFWAGWPKDASSVESSDARLLEAGVKATQVFPYFLASNQNSELEINKNRTNEWQKKVITLHKLFAQFLKLQNNIDLHYVLCISKHFYVSWIHT
jgi:hypothetical protein